ncbi:hypothetical protein CBR_g54893 [Chara braunii]|uniref:Retrotransposon gag domain-containing protein n=1 Tax=Chara braunii TaxID=69332 RepID=A0A388JPP2_CHABU|nr:hypothetical protein CBR_g54893 [Chara braunii]|eukprot:GBG59789.1 hypothetical protein CBR_g54893 [Chara braunii]
MATASATSATTSGLGMSSNSTSSQSVSNTSDVGASQMAGVQSSLPPHLLREQMELRQVERIRLRLAEELKYATKKDKEIRERRTRLESREADLAALEGLDNATLDSTGKILKASVMSMQAYTESKMDAMEDTLDQILQALQRPGIRTTTKPLLPLSAMTGPYAAQSGQQPSGSSSAITDCCFFIFWSSDWSYITVATCLAIGTAKTPLKPPPIFSGDKKDEALDTWLRTTAVWVRAKRTLVEEEVITTTSYLEGSAARWLNGLVASKGFGRNMGDWAQTHTLESFWTYARWHNPQQAQIGTDGLLKLDASKYKSVRELSTAVERLIVVPGVEYNPQQDDGNGYRPVEFMSARLPSKKEDAEAARKAADERCKLRRDKILECEGDIEVIVGEWAVAAEEEGAPPAVRGLATTVEHVSDLVATCAAQQEDILCVDTLVRKQIRISDELLDRVRRLEQQPTTATPAGPSNLTDRVNVLEIDVETLKDGALATNQRIDQQICAAAASPTATTRESIPKFDGLPIFCDATKTDPIPWWRQFELKLDIHHVINPNRHAYLYSRSGGTCQAWLDNMLSMHNVAVSELHTKISWADLKAAWHKRFQVEPPELQAAEKLQRFYENDLPSTDLITKYRRLASTPNLSSTFVAIKHFFIRSCPVLQNALTQVAETLTTSEQRLDKASQIIVMNIEAKNLGHSSAAGQGRGQHRPKVAVVAATTATDPSNEAASSDEGDRLAAARDGGRPARGRGCGKPKTHTNSSPGAGPAAQEPWTHYGISEGVYRLRTKYRYWLWCNSAVHDTAT